MILGENDPTLRELTEGGRPRWQWESMDGSDFQASHQVWLFGADSQVMWEVWVGSTCLGVHATGKKGEAEARELIAQVRKSGRDHKFARAAYEGYQGVQSGD